MSAFTKRIKWMRATVCSAFGMKDEQEFETLRKQEENNKKIMEFLNGHGPARLFFFYRCPYEKGKDSREPHYTSPDKELVVNFGESEILQDKAVYFVRTTGNKSVNPAAENDSEVIAGEIPQAAVNSLEVLLNAVLKPMIENMQPQDWGQCDEEHKKEFLGHLRKFSQDLNEAIVTLTGGVQLPKIDPAFEQEARASGKAPSDACVANCRMKVNQWIEIVDRFTRESVEAEEKKEATEEGPLSELEHWRGIQQNLTSISEQIKGTACMLVTNVLHTAKSPTSQIADKDSIGALLSTWKRKESELTEKLNEAKDNVKYLRTLEPYLEPLYQGKPTLIIESLPGLMHAIKMMFSIARHYDKGSRMTTLFSKITNQMITSCQSAILKGGEPKDLWDTTKYPIAELRKVLSACVDLNTEYKKHFAEIKAKLNANPKGKHYEFTDTAIFGKFDLFVRRVLKLRELFETIEQFNILGKHNLENMKSISTDFEKELNELKTHNETRLLEYKKNEFDINFVSFISQVSQIESKLMQFINDKVSQVHSIELSIKFLEKFKGILKRSQLQKDLAQKSSVLFSTFVATFKDIETHYERDKDTPPLVRNMPEHAGHIMWLSHLYNKVARPLRKFDKEVRQNKENRTNVKKAWDFLRTIGVHKLLIHDKWVKRVESSKAALQATLLEGGTGKEQGWGVNFEPEIMTLIREAKCMSRMGMKLNENAKIILLQEEKFKTYYNELDYLIKEYNRISNRIRNNTAEILKPHVEDLETRLRPGSITLTWTSMNIDGYLQHVHEGFRKLEQFVIKINDIMDNRIENNLKEISKTKLVDLTLGQKAFSLDEFVNRQVKCIEQKSKGLKAKNQEVEQAVNDLRKAILSYPRDPHVGQVSNDSMQNLIKYYYWSMYQALLHATKQSLNDLKARVCERKKDAKEQNLKPFFEVRVQLEGSVCVLNPPLASIQAKINQAANAVLKSTKHVSKWKKGKQETFYEWVAKDKEIVKVILLLTGSIEGTKNEVEKFLQEFQKYSWLWKDDIVKSEREFSAKATSNEEFEIKLKEFKETEEQINKITPSKNIGAMEIKTDKIKETLLGWLKLWKREYFSDLNKRVKNRVDALKDEIKRLTFRVRREVKDLATLGEVMQTLDDIRIKESEIKVQLKPVSEIYSLLETYLSDVQEKDEENQKKLLETDWKRLVAEAEQRRNDLQLKQSVYKKDLINSIRTLMEETKDFCKEFLEKGPKVPGIAPNEALDRLKSYKSKYDEVLKRKRENCERGEKIFNLTHKKYEELDQTEKEMNWLGRLYALYSDVIKDIATWKETPWSEVQKSLKTMTEDIVKYDTKCQGLDDELKKWPAYQELKDHINNFKQALPLIELMSKPSILQDHWEKDLSEKLKRPIVFKLETFTLGTFLDWGLNHYEDEIKEISKAADEQLWIKTELAEIHKHWESEEFVLTTTARKKDAPCALEGKKIEDIINKLEEHQTRINAMTALRSSKPMQEQLSQASNKYSEVYDIINKWMKVQKIWQFLEPVFHTPDISKNMVQESKKFGQIEKDWIKIIEKVNESKNVVACCENDMLKGLLTSLEVSLEFCQKKLDTYLEKKRREFPRFYFVSDTEVLNILSQGSDPSAVQSHLPSLFDGITNIEFDGAEKKQICKIMCVYPDGQKEELDLVNAVKVEQKIEEWLQYLEDEMKNTVKKCIEKAVKAADPSQKSFSAEKEIPELVNKYPSQICQVILRRVWTSMVELGRTDMPPGRRTSKDTIHNEMENIIKVLSNMIKSNAEEGNDALKRIKLEGLITIQVYQFGVYNRINTGDYDMEKQKSIRMRWDNDTKDLMVEITDASFAYFYEFLKATDKLVITPLTDRCYISLAQAIKRLQCGGCTIGPSGVGKTETIKDLGKTLGMFVIVTNCSPEHNAKAIAKLLKGTVASGVWGCFDEFIRIKIDVLSVIAGQIEAIADIKRRGNVQKFDFPGESPELGGLKCVESSAYFITYRTRLTADLPENIKLLFRPMAMMQPEFKTIIEVKLQAMGFTTYEKLAEKFTLLYSLCPAQLSKQKHYDFGLRNILPVFSAMGNLKKALGDPREEEKALARALRDINSPKLVGQDTTIFSGLLRDIFPEGFEQDIIKEYAGLEAVIEDNLTKNNLQSGRNWKPKLLQLLDISLVRHGIIIVGPAGCGKTTMTQILLDSLQTHKGMQYKPVRLNPKAISIEDLYGSKTASGEWIDGVFTKIWEKCNKRSFKQNTWVILDGPLDSIWIESLNSVLDDNKVLTLANGQRIPMTENVRLVFEIDQLTHAEPSTVGRCGILYVAAEDLGWRPLFSSYLKGRTDRKTVCNPNEMSIVDELIKKYLEDTNLIETVEKDYSPVMASNPAIRASSFIGIFNSLLKMHTTSTLDRSAYEMLFVFALCWSMGGLLEADKRDHFQKFLMDKGAPIPQLFSHKATFEKETIFDSYLEKEGNGVIWKPFSVPRWEPVQGTPFSQVIIPTLDTVRAEYLFDLVASIRDVPECSQRSALIMGSAGTAKSSAVLLYAQNKRDKLFKMFTFSALTSPQILQDGIESQLMRKRARNFEPEGDQTMLMFFDDMNMPMVNQWGDQPTLELIRQLLEQNGLYFLNAEQRGDFMNIARLQFIGAISQPGGGWNDIPNRLKRLFMAFNISMPTQQGLETVFGALLNHSFTDKQYKPEVIKIAQSLVDATSMLRNKILKALPVTPAKFHYKFTMREVAKVFEGIMLVNLSPEFEVIQNSKEGISSELYLIMLWKHECMRAFHDKLTNEGDRKLFIDSLETVMQEKFKDLLPEDENIWKNEWHFCNFLRKGKIGEGGVEIDTPKVYEAADPDVLQKICTEKLDLYNSKVPKKVLDLVLFDEAIKNLLKISRTIQLKRGSAVLVGVGGSGRQSLTKLAAFIAGQEIKQLETTSKEATFESLKEIYKSVAAMGSKPATILLVENDFKDEIIFDHISSFLTTGEITKLIMKDDKEKLWMNNKETVMKETLGKEEPIIRVVYKYLVNRVRDNLHIVLSVSQNTSKLLQRFKMFPAVFTSTNIIWFLPWPETGLVNVAKEFIAKIPMECSEEVKDNLSKHMAHAFVTAQEASEKYLQRMRRHVYLTPRNYLSYLNSFTSEYVKRIKSQSQNEDKIKVGIVKMEEANMGLEEIRKQLNKEQSKQTAASTEVDKLLQDLTESKATTTRKNEEVERKKDECEKKKDKIKKDKESVDQELGKTQAGAAYNDAIKAVQAITPSMLGDVKNIVKPPLADITKLVSDCLLILLQKFVITVAWFNYERSKGDTYAFIKDSFEDSGRVLLTSATLQKKLLEYTQTELDTISDETCELLEPYLELPRLKEEHIAKSSPLLGHLLEWIRAVYKYHNASKSVKAKKADIVIQCERLKKSEDELSGDIEKLKTHQSELDALVKKFTKQNEEKEMIKQQVKGLNARLTNLQKLISELQEDRNKWKEEADKFSERKLQMLGDVSIASAFISYCGAFNLEFRTMILKDLITSDLADKQIPKTDKFDLVSFLVDDSTMGEWQMEGLASKSMMRFDTNDEFTTQNTIILSMANRFPLLIDPQAQGINWVKQREKNIENKVISMGKINDPAQSDLLRIAMENGEAVLIENMETILPSTLEQVLDAPCGKFVKRGVNILYKNAEVKVDEKFMLYLTTRIHNPHFSPELASRTVIIDFSMTEKALQKYLLSRLIMKEQKSIEEQLFIQLNNIFLNKKNIQEIGQNILQMIAACQGSLLDNDQVVEDLNKLKKRVTETNQKMKEAEEKKKEILKKRKNYKGVAKRGAALYFTMLDMANINWMYTTSIEQFYSLFDISIAIPKKATTLKERADSISNNLTENVFKFMNRALFAKDKALFALYLSLRIKLVEGLLKTQDISFFLKAGSSIEERTKSTYQWLDEASFANLKALAKHKFGVETTIFFKDLFDKIGANDQAWEDWKKEATPEEKKIPDYEDSKMGEKDTAPFMKLCMIRCLREDRTIMAANKFVISVLGPKFEKPTFETIEEIYPDTNKFTPVLFLLSSGSDPTTSIEELCKKKLKKSPLKLALGEGQDKDKVKEAIESVMNPANPANLNWVLLQNCHLGVGILRCIYDILSNKSSPIAEDFRLFLTTEETTSFPLDLLHISMKVTNEPPKGIQAGMLRTLNQVVPQERLEKVDNMDAWKSVVFSMCVMHNVFLERRKFGPLGFCHPYEFSNNDLDSCLQYLERLSSPSGNFEESKWKMAKFMVGEILYGGKITDERDRELLITYCEDFLKGEVVKSVNYELIKPSIVIPKLDIVEVQKLKDEVKSWKIIETPEMYGLKNLADKGYRLKESKDLLSMLLEIQPKDLTVSAAKTRDEEVKEKLEKEIRPKIPQGFKDSDKKGDKKGGMITPPMFVFLNQEIRRFQAVHTFITKSITEILMAIDGQIIMSKEIEDAIISLHNGKVPSKWMYDSIGYEVSWLSASSASWIKELVCRYNQLSSWLKADKLGSYWLGGFLNPQGFLFAFKQEEVRRKREKEKEQLVSLEMYDFTTDVPTSQPWTEVDKFDYKVTAKKGADKSGDEVSVLVHGLYIEGAEWGNNKLKDCEKDIISIFPIVRISVTRKSDESQKAGMSGKGYLCPVYKYSLRSDRYLITKFKLEPKTDDKTTINYGDFWKKRGVALLCSREYLN